MIAFLRTNIRIFALMLLMCFQSCQYFEKKASKEKLLQKELQAINWTQLDEFPMISDCEKMPNNEQQKQCFFEFLSADLKNRIKKNLHKKVVLNDTIFIKITILHSSKILFNTQKSVSLDSLLVKNIDSILKTDTLNFPKIKPALKRGMAVKSEFILPIVFQ